LTISVCKRPALLFVILSSLWLFVACEQQNKYVEPPPPKVTVAKPLQKTVVNYLEFTGNTQAIEQVDVRARVAGFLQSKHFTPGTEVAEGDLLFVIDPREYQAEVKAAQAELGSAEAQLKRADIELGRAKRLYKQKAGSEAEVVKWQGESEIAKAAVTRAKAKLDRARLELSYTKVTAPLAGRISRNLVDVGNLVGEGEATLLTRITKYDPMHVYFNLNERDLLMVMAMYRQRVIDKGLDPSTESDARTEIPLYLGLANEEGHPHKGIADFAESSVDPETGTLQLRGVFPNPGKAPVLVPGLFARIQMPIDKQDDALLVSERALGADQGGRYLLVVNEESVVEKRPILLGRLADGLRVISEGLQPGELVIVNGLQRARPGGKVEPERIEMSTLTASALRAAADQDQAQESPDEETPSPTGGTQEEPTEPAMDSAEDTTTSETTLEGGVTEAAQPTE
jgi:RND family efflux transporter MFP subunit